MLNEKILQNVEALMSFPNMGNPSVQHRALSSAHYFGKPFSTRSVFSDTIKLSPLLFPSFLQIVEYAVEYASFFGGLERVEILLVDLALSFVDCGLWVLFVCLLVFILIGCYMLLPLNARKSKVKELSLVLLSGP